MTRIPRQKSRTGIYHIMLRGINKQVIYEDNQDRRRFLETLKKVKENCNFNIYSYCLMDNHVHLLVKESEHYSISKIIQRVSSSYVRWYNRKYDRCGHLFQERFKSENVETKAYFLRVIRYIHHNPIKAGLSSNVFECKWSSINEYMGGVEMVDIDKVFSLFSSDREEAISLFSDYMLTSNEDQCLDEDMENKMSDSMVRELLTEHGIKNSSILQQMDREERDATIAVLKQIEGVSIRQLSRVTGISRSVIQRVR